MLEATPAWREIDNSSGSGKTTDRLHIDNKQRTSANVKMTDSTTKKNRGQTDASYVRMSRSTEEYQTSYSAGTDEQTCKREGVMKIDPAKPNKNKTQHMVSEPTCYLVVADEPTYR